MSSFCESSIKLNLVKQKIISSLLVSDYDLISICFARIYTADSHKTPNWLYSELEGGLTLVIDHTRKSARFMLFDLMTLEITFECEFYKNFHVFYNILAETFQCFEVPGGFIGFSIPDKIAARTFSKSVSILSDAIISKRLKINKLVNKNEIKSIAKINLDLLKKKLEEEYFFKEVLSEGKKIEFDAFQIESLFNLIEYDNSNETFCVNGTCEEIDELMTKVNHVKFSEKAGLKVHDKKAYALEIFNNVINSNKVSDKAEKERLHYEKTGNLKLSLDVLVMGNKSKELNNNNNSSNASNKQNTTNTAPVVSSKNVITVPTKNVPAIPKGVPAIPKGVPAIPKGIPAAPKGVPAIPKGVPPIPKGVPAIPKGVPAIPKGVPPIPKGVPPVPVVPKDPIIKKPASNANTINNTINITAHQNQNATQTINTDTIVNQNPLTESPQILEQNLIPPKKLPPKIDMLSELRMKLANRQSAINTPSNQQIPILIKVEKPDTNIITQDSLNKENIKVEEIKIPTMKLNPQNNACKYLVNNTIINNPTTPNTYVNVPSVNNLTIINSESGTTNQPKKGIIPPVPKGIPLPPKPKINLMTKTVKTEQINTGLTLKEEIEKGIQLKKVLTEEKGGINALFNNKSGSTGNNAKENSKLVSNSDVKSNMFEEMKKVQLRKVNK